MLGVKGDYSRSQDDFELHLKTAHDEYGVQNYYVMDETFNDRTEKITKFADVVERLSFRPYFAGFNRADLLISRPADREEMLRMNFLGQFYGIESLNHQTGKAVGKGMHPDKIKAGLLDLKSYYHRHSPGKYNGTISIIIGLPHETIASIHEANEWLLENWQGHFWTWIPLEILIGERDKPSMLAKNYEKYGYTEIPGTGPEYHTSGVQLGKAIKWRNPDMDYYDSWRLAAQFNDDALQRDIRLPCYYLGFLSPQNLTLEQRLSVHLGSLDELKSAGKQIVAQYKNRKLSYV